jgi:hypothetical protein
VKPKVVPSQGVLNHPKDQTELILALADLE